MTQPSAADFERRRGLEGAPDPFPGIVEAPTQAGTSRSGNQDQVALDTDSEIAFPSLAPAPYTAAARPVATAWGAGAGPRIAPAVPMQAVVTDSFTLSTDIAGANLGRDGRPASLGEITKQIMQKFSKVRIEASSNIKSRQTTFLLKSESAKELEKTKRQLVAAISPVVSIVIDAPASTIPSIIGSKGVTLKQIRDQTGVKVDIPRKENVVAGPVKADGHVQSGSDEDEEPVVPVTISGPDPLVQEARDMINDIIASRAVTSVQRVRDIPENVLPFVIACRAEFLAMANGIDISLTLNQPSREITARGDREAVGRVVQKIKATIEFFKRDLNEFRMNLPKRQHRLLVGRVAEEIVATCKCAVIVPPPEDPSDQISVWGNANDLARGMAAVMQKANSQYIHEFPLPGPIKVSKQILAYMSKTGYPKTLAAAHPSVAVYPPSTSEVNTALVLNFDIVGEKPAVDAAVQDLSRFIADLMGGTDEVEVDWTLHMIISGKFAKKIKQLYDDHNVRLFFPDEALEESSILLVYDPISPSASKNPQEKKKHLDEVQKELIKLASVATDVKSELISIETKWHSYITGSDGTTLDALIGEDKALSIKIGKEAGGETDDCILVRGLSQDVDRTVTEIRAIVENAKKELIENSYTVEFDISKDFVGRVVGSYGAAVNKLRESLGVRIDFSDEGDKEHEGGKKKKPAVQRTKVKIVGREENVEEAKKRILSQVERLADETSEILKIPNQYHPSLIGPSGKYVTRLESNYSVKITFPRGESHENGEGRTRENLKPDEILVKGNRKGVADAKFELLEAYEVEKESNIIEKFSVPAKAIARILGRGGSNINEIKEETGAQIDVDRSGEDLETVSISCRGTKQAIADAKAEILTIVEQVEQELMLTVNVERRFHRTIIGAGGQGLRDLITRCGGSSDPKQQASLIRFPPPSEPSDEIRLRGEANLVKKLKAEIVKIAASLHDRVVIYVEVPNVRHRILIGKNGQNLNDLQNRTEAQVQFPGSRSYNMMGEVENADQFRDADPKDLVKVAGSRTACEKATKELTENVREPAPEPVTGTVSVPLKYHYSIIQQGQFFRTLRDIGVNVDQSVVPTKPALPARPPSESAATARIDDNENEEAAAEIEWQVVSNYQNAEEGDSEWTLKARTATGLEKAKRLIAEAIQHAEASSSIGFLTLPDCSTFPRIIGTRGANISRLRAETGADITVNRDNNTIIIIGSDSAIEDAKEAILRITNSRSGRRGG